jgi:hypothetical protein
MGMVEVAMHCLAEGGNGPSSSTSELRGGGLARGRYSFNSSPPPLTSSAGDGTMTINALYRCKYSILRTHWTHCSPAVGLQKLQSITKDSVPVLSQSRTAIGPVVLLRPAKGRPSTLTTVSPRSHNQLAHQPLQSRCGKDGLGDSHPHLAPKS